MGTVLFTGSVPCIGKAAAERFHETGWDVHAPDVDTDGLAALAELGCRTHRMDVTDRLEIPSVADRLEASGEDAVDGVASNIGDRAPNLAVEAAVERTTSFEGAAAGV